MSSLTAEEFVNCCDCFVKASSNLRDCWEKKLDQNNFPFLVKKFTRNLAPSTINESGNAIEASEHFITIECHVVYSESYCNPVLYFTACKLNGRTLKLKDCWNLVHDSAKHVTDKWSFLTQVEHPINGRPCFQLHPCHTKDFMQHFNNNSQYLLSWLSVMMPVLGLTFPSETYHKYFNELSLWCNYF